MSDKGMATLDEYNMIKEFEATIDVNSSPIADVLKLANLYIRPLVKEGPAITILEKILERDPGNAWATYWLAFCLLHHGLDLPSLIRARDLLNGWLNNHSCGEYNRETCSAIYELLYEIRSDPYDLNDLPKSEAISLLERAVSFWPSWPKSRFSLALLFVDIGRIDDAIVQLKAAQSLTIRADPNWDLAKEYFERSVTGRANDYMRDEIPKILKMLESTGDGGEPI
jgi:tetratricopeptide (TPR) repeat protein